MLTGLTFGNVRFTEVVDCRDEFPEAAETPCRRRHEMWQERGIFSRVWPNFTYIIVQFFAYNQPWEYRLTIYRFAIIVCFSKYRWNIVIAFFLTISHDIYLISTHTESPYWWIKVPIGEAIFRWKWHKKSKYTPHKWSLTGKYRFPKKL